MYSSGTASQGQLILFLEIVISNIHVQFQQKVLTDLAKRKIFRLFVLLR